MRETYEQACHSNDGRPTCTECHVPTAWDSGKMCVSCRRDDSIQRFRLQPAFLLTKET